MKLLIYGARGWIGGQIAELARERGWEVVEGTARADLAEDVERELRTRGPDRVLCAMGRTHGPGCNTVDYLEDHLDENVRDNLFGPMVLAHVCSQLGIHLAYLGTGCIFHDGLPRHPSDRTAPGAHFNEESIPNFKGSSYSTVKGCTDQLMSLYHPETVLNVRIRMPINDELSNRNFISKIASYPRILSTPNSVTVLPTLLPILLDLVEHEATGTIHLVNPGAVTHDEVLGMYREIVDPNHTWQNIDESTHDSMLKSRRSVTVLDTARLTAMYPNVPDAKTAIRECLERIRSKL